MKGFIRKSVAAASILCVLLSGCGTNVAQLTEEEEQIIVAYASGAVAKANKHQEQGLTYPPMEEEDVEEESEEPAEEDVAEEEQQTDSSSGQEIPDNQPEEGNTVTEASLTDALNISGLVAEYHGYQVKDNYMEGDYFALYAESGKTYLIVNVGLTNTTEQPMECNFLAKNLQCVLKLNGTEVADAMETILLTDFILYINTLEAGASEDTIMIFEITKEQADAIDTVELELSVDGTSYQINLE